MNALDWDHNAYYHRLVLRHLPRPCNRVLDVGCGAGAFAVELAKRAEHVDALDRSPAMIEEAKRVVPPNATCILADVLQEPLPDARYDAIVSISALHHTPVEAVLPRLAGALRPGGVLVAAPLYPDAICYTSCPPSSPQRSVTGCSGPHLPSSEPLAEDAGTRRKPIT
jgi:ubiquinone/menaquinone biosynthesis C-methylase UbiE